MRGSEFYWDPDAGNGELVDEKPQEDDIIDIYIDFEKNTWDFVLNGQFKANMKHGSSKKFEKGRYYRWALSTWGDIIFEWILYDHAARIA